jgi:sugar O-acyltransferase (sialic acid O-acetyltransferase NeuD family)
MTVLRIVGDGGLSREVEMLALGCDPSAWERFERLSPDQENEALSQAGDVAMGVGSPRVRRELFSRWGASGHLSWPVLVHHAATVGPRCALGRGVGVQAGVIMTTDVTVGEFSYLNLLVTLGHDVRIGHGCLLNPSVNVSGGATIGDGVLVGVGAVILENLTIGDGATIGAGAVVTRNVEPGVTVVGVPARPVGGEPS